MATKIDPAAVAAFSQKGIEVRDQMQQTLGRTRQSVEEAISPAVWGGQASSAFGDVTARYNAASTKLNAHLQELLDTVNTASKKLDGADADHAGNLKAAGGGLNHGV